MKIGIALLALMGLLVACDQPTQPTPAAQPAQPEIKNRFQIVNGTPELTRNIMLLDTQTGDSWQICGSNKPNEISGWCLMTREPK
jgi:hypothetical protein